MAIIPLEQAAVWVHPAVDNVAVAVRDLAKGLVIQAKTKVITLQNDIPAGHRFALETIPANAAIHQYGQPFALSQGILPGELVSNGNTINLPGTILRHSQHIVFKLPAWQGKKPIFQGFLRSDGQAGTRNYVVVIPASMCASHEARLIADTAERFGLYSPARWPNVDGVTCTPHTFGCGCRDPQSDEPPVRFSDGMTTLTMLRRLIEHPNVGGVLLVDLGCEKTNFSALARLLFGQEKDIGDLSSFFGKPIEHITIQRVGGTKSAVRAGLEAVGKLLSAANNFCRQPLPASKLVLGLKCGGSDAFSGITANPALGAASDLLIRAGGRSLISEIPEFFGAEHLFAARAVNDEVEKRIWEFMVRFRDELITYGGSFEDNPSPGNQAGGLLNIAIKSLGAVSKSGLAPVMAALEYLEPIWKYGMNGLYLLYAPGYDQISTPALVASGCQLVCFTTGRGTGIGNAIAPVIKIASNTTLMQRMNEDMDLNAGQILEGEVNIQTMGEQIFEKIIQVASGEKVKAEENGHREFAIWGREKVTL